MTLASQLLTWYYENARDLPWRQNNDAYKVWVSEIMLQQTRVEAVKNYYTRWMERFPTLDTLARSSEQEVLTYWQGLGYYSRARNLLLGVREVCARYDGKVPDNAAEILRLPGVGEYTAGAIASIAYNRPVPAVDGNVLRIFSRLFCIEDDITKQGTKRKIHGLIQNCMPKEQPGNFNQALMDLGSAICIPGHPRCSLCPLTKYCEAYAREVQDVLPVRPPRKQPLHVTLASGIVKNGESLLVRQRPSTGLLAKMWEFPSIELEKNSAPSAMLPALIKADLAQEIVLGQKLFHCIHTFSHRKWDITFFDCRWLDGGALPPFARWLPISEITSLPWAGPHLKAAAALFK
ncbi:MAG: mutY 1 [Firmicutes bacterium]|nr:mutY 1 [Bacillota bacterium]